MKLSKAWVRIITVLVAAGSSCALAQPADESFHVLMPEQAKLWWGRDLTHSRPPQYPPEALIERAEGCIALSYEIHADGSVTPVRFLKEDLSTRARDLRKAFEGAVVASAVHSLYQPTPSNTERAPVFTYGISTFRLEDSRSAESELRRKCEVPDFLKQVQSESDNK